MQSQIEHNRPKAPFSIKTFPVSLELLRMPSQGIAYDLCSGWWTGMPMADGPPCISGTYIPKSGRAAEPARSAVPR